MLSRRIFLGGLITAIATTRIHAYGRKPYRIGISDSVIEGKPDNAVKDSMCGVFELNGKPRCEFEMGAAETIVQGLQKEDVDIAVLTGIEYAWLKAAYPELLPLVTAYTTGVVMRSCILVREDSPDKSLIDLQSDTLALPERLKRHNYIYLHDAILKCGGKPQSFFGRTLAVANSDEGIESIIVKKADAILVDSDSWLAFQERKPARSKNVRVLHKSGAFPTPIILYHQKTINKLEAMILKIGLCSAHDRPYARQMLNFWGVAKFVPYGRAYQKAVDQMLKEIPATIIPARMVSK